MLQMCIRVQEMIAVVGAIDCIYHPTNLFWRTFTGWIDR